ncbi:hypothetical protein NDU88_001413 [Pleurodeles waltl]|uniref:Uncharacterized protein n=1 Tax=Pleurodeles waltl TaxID=8319 RepID=A0AAV7MNM9_PLEWA|nr:hypothetical protein NDU88_001413 [Pleurodeles waltl]
MCRWTPPKAGACDAAGKKKTETAAGRVALRATLIMCNEMSDVNSELLVKHYFYSKVSQCWSLREENVKGN